jgi:magnesium-transporting ATPase (P-type)
VQEQRSEQSLQALNKLVPHHCHVLREGQTFHILANELVPGDIVTFATGDRIPADIRVVAAVDLEVDESSLTGETEARKKGVETCVYGGGGARGVREPVALAERASVAHMGSLVRNGRGTGIVIATGTATELGVVFSMVQDVRPVSLRVYLLTGFRAGRGETDTAAVEHGRAREEALDNLVRYHRRHLYHRGAAAPLVARHVYHRRYAARCSLNCP